jgi:DNA repair protein RecN (Recombination protein N)
VLTNIYIKNFAIISELNLPLPKGLIALTGETGAGKSIILGAINLLLGARADSHSLYNKSDKCIIEAHFDITKNVLIKNVLQNFEIDFTNELIIRREIQPSGKSRAFVNDTPVLLHQLESLGELLIDLHRQFDTLEVKNSDYQLQIIDAIADNYLIVKEYKNVYATWKKETTVLVQLQQEQLQLQQEFDFNNFQYQEIAKLNLLPLEIENAEQELNVLANADAVKQTLFSVYNKLSDNDDAIIVQLKNCINQLNHQANTIKKIQPFIARLNESLIEIKDVAQEIESLDNIIEVDQSKLEIITNRFNEGTRLLKKYNAVDTNNLLEIQENLNQKLQKISNSDAIIAKQQHIVSDLLNQINTIGLQLSETRKNASIAATKQINELLPKVGMPNALLKIEVQKIDNTSSGFDRINFMFDANNKNNFLPIAKSASGGELSRLMLCIKSLLAKFTQLPTLVFDEIDAGISGEVAKQVAIILQQLSNSHQIITVTHLPQIAAKAHHHLYVYKQTDDNKNVNTQVKLLSSAERVTHIAEMLSGKTPTATALLTAKELLQQ